MAVVTFRVPFGMPYGYAEIEVNTEEENLDVNRYEELANMAIAMEDAVIRLGGGAKAFSPGADEARKNGAEYIHNDGAVNSTPRMDQGEPCQSCGQAGKWDTTKNGKRVLKCNNGCVDNVNGRNFPHTIRWQN